MARHVFGRKVIDALIASGIADESTVRVVLDISVRGFVTAYVQKIGDDRVLDVVAHHDLGHGRVRGPAGNGRYGE
jgi:hypothetical protein